MPIVLYKDDATKIADILNGVILDSTGMWHPDALEEIQGFVKLLGGVPEEASLRPEYNKKNKERKGNHRK